MELTLLFSYQSDLDKCASKLARQDHHTHTDFLKYCIQKAIEQVERKGKLKYVSIQYVDTTTMIKNDESIEAVVERLTKSCHIFVADLTCTRNYPKLLLGIMERLNLNTKREANNNVCHEYGMVRGRLGISQIIKVMNISQGDPKVDDKCLPVDFRGKRHPIGYRANIKDEFTIEENERKSFINALAEAIFNAAEEAVALKAIEYLPFIGWDEHCNGFNNRGRFIDGAMYKDIQSKVLSSPQQIIRIKGMSGMGKTRMVLEAFRGKEERFSYLYADCYDIDRMNKFSDFYNQLRKIFADTKNQDLILIIDNCDNERWRDILSKRRSARSRVKLISITHDMLDEFGDDEEPIVLPKSMPDIVSGILDARQNDYETRYRERIEKFAGGIPLMAHLLLDGLRENRALGVIDEATIWDKVFGHVAGSEERKMLQTIALFNWIGYEDERVDEIEFVATNKDITSLDGSDKIIINKFGALIAEGIQRGFIEQKGRLISIRPKPLAMRLIEEWIKGCDRNRLLKVMKAISTHPTFSLTLSAAFGDQMKDMKYLENRSVVVKTIFSPDSPFVTAEVLNTELGSHLFRAFVEVDPDTIADRLWLILVPLSIDELKLMEQGRRNLVWTLEKICFNASTFEKGAEMLLRLAVAETEHFSNNATGQFVRLFYMQLAATEVGYDMRIRFLKRVAEVAEYKPMVLRAIKAALGTSHPIFFTGAEKFGTEVKQYYKPRSIADIRQYCKDCMDLLASFMVHGEYVREVKDILTDGIWYQTTIGNLDLYAPIIDEYILKEHGKWNDMLVVLQHIAHDERITLSSTEQEQLTNWIAQLTQSDFVSRFLYVEQKRRWESSADYEGQVQNEREEYQSLAREFVAFYNKEYLSQIYASQALNTDAFGSELAYRFDGEGAKNFIDDSIEILQKSEKKYNSIFISFGKNLTKEIYGYLKNAIIPTSLVELLFPIIAGRSERVDNEETNSLFNLVAGGKVSVASFIQYMYNFRFDKMDDEQVRNLLGKIIEINTEDSLLTAITIASNYAHWYSEKCRISLDYIREIMMSQIHELTKPLLDELSFHHIVNQLLDKKSDVEWANWVCDLYAKQLLNDITIIQYNPHAHETLTILCSQYFEKMWAKIEDIYEQADEFTRYRIGLMFGVIQGAERGIGHIIFTPEHDEILLSWCERHRDYAPLHVARMAPLYDTIGQFTHLIQSIIDIYGTDKRVLDELAANLGSMLTVGSAVDPHLHQLDVLRPLMTHKSEDVRKWASQMMKRVEKEVKQIQNEEDEMTAKYS